MSDDLVYAASRPVIASTFWPKEQGGWGILVQTLFLAFWINPQFSTIVRWGLFLAVFLLAAPAQVLMDSWQRNLFNSRTSSAIQFSFVGIISVAVCIVLTYQLVPKSDFFLTLGILLGASLPFLYLPKNSMLHKLWGAAFLCLSLPLALLGAAHFDRWDLVFYYFLHVGAAIFFVPQYLKHQRSKMSSPVTFLGIGLILFFGMASSWIWSYGSALLISAGFIFCCARFITLWRYFPGLAPKTLGWIECASGSLFTVLLAVSYQ